MGTIPLTSLLGSNGKGNGSKDVNEKSLPNASESVSKVWSLSICNQPIILSNVWMLEEQITYNRWTSTAKYSGSNKRKCISRNKLNQTAHRETAEKLKTKVSTTTLKYR